MNSPITHSGAIENFGWFIVLLSGTFRFLSALFGDTGWEPFVLIDQWFYFIVVFGLGLMFYKKIQSVRPVMYVFMALLFALFVWAKWFR